MPLKQSLLHYVGHMFSLKISDMHVKGSINTVVPVHVWLNYEFNVNKWRHIDFLKILKICNVCQKAYKGCLKHLETGMELFPKLVVPQYGRRGLNSYGQKYTTAHRETSSTLTLCHTLPSEGELFFHQPPKASQCL